MTWRLYRKWYSIVAVLVVMLVLSPAAAAGRFTPWIGSITGASAGSSTFGSATANSYVIYGDALASGWYNQSWDASVNYRNTRSVYTGLYSISYTATAAWAGLDIRNDIGVNGASYGQLSFALRATQSNQRYAVYLRDTNGKNLSQPVSLDGYGGQPVSGAWKTYTIPLADLHAGTAVIGHVVFHEWSGKAQPAVYVDQIQLTGQGSTPPPTPSPTPVPVVAPTPVPVVAPQPNPTAGVLWSANTETGNLNQWTQGQYGEAVFNSGTGSVSVTNDVAHSGSSALKMTITEANGTSQAARIFRWNDSQGNALPASAYYSVWYYFPQSYTPAQWWNIFQFKSKTSSGSVDPMWVLNVGNRSNGNMYLYLWDAMHRHSYAASSTLDLPVGRWVHLEAYFQRSTGSTGQITIWQDGVKLFDLNGIQTTTAGNQQWSLANYTDNISPSSPVIYADDAVISTNYVP